MERLAQSSSSRAIPDAPAPPELARDGRKLTKKEKKEVCFLTFRLSCVANVHNTRERRKQRDQAGSTFQPQTQLIFLDSTGKSKRFVCEIHWIRRDSTEKRTVKGKVSRVYQSNLL